VKILEEMRARKNTSFSFKSQRETKTHKENLITKGSGLLLPPKDAIHVMWGRMQIPSSCMKLYDVGTIITHPVSKMKRQKLHCVTQL
jgi:hypothetical protein